MKNDNNGSDFFGTLTIIFIILKLCKVINWCWFLVLSPSLIHGFIYLICVIIIYIMNRRCK